MFNVWLVLVFYHANENCQYLDHPDLSVGRELYLCVCQDQIRRGKAFLRGDLSCGLAKQLLHLTL